MAALDLYKREPMFVIISTFNIRRERGRGEGGGKRARRDFERKNVCAHVVVSKRVRIMTGQVYQFVYLVI